MKQNCLDILKYSAIIFGGIVFRWILLNSSYQKIFESRVEISTPFTSWIRINEGVHLHRLNISPYSGDTFHEQPLFLHFYVHLLSLPELAIDIILIGIDVLAAILLSQAVRSQLQTLSVLENKSLQHFKPVTDATLLSIRSPSESALLVAFVYLLNPLSFLIVAARSSAIFSNFFVGGLLYCCSHKWRMSACFFAAILTYQSLHFFPLFIAATLIIELQRSLQNQKRMIVYDLQSILCSFSIFTLQLGALFFTSYYLNNQSWSFLSSTYYYNLTVQDLTPNIGLSWYFFTEMFDHFRNFFLAIFQVNSLIYSIPFAFTLRKNPFFLFFVYLILHSLFKPYPSASDLLIYLALLPQWSHFFRLMKQGLVISCVFASCAVLAPIMWQMWIVLGTANANFYFSVTLAYNTAQIFLLTDLLFAFIKREFFLDTGSTEDENGKPLSVELTHS